MLNVSYDANTLSWLTSSKNDDSLFFKSEFGAGLLYTPVSYFARELANRAGLFLSLIIAYLSS